MLLQLGWVEVLRLPVLLHLLVTVQELPLPVQVGVLPLPVQDEEQHFPAQVLGWHVQDTLFPILRLQRNSCV